MTGDDFCLHANTDLNNVVQLCLFVVVERRSNSQVLFCLSLSRGITHLTELPMLKA